MEGTWQSHSHDCSLLQRPALRIRRSNHPFDALACSSGLQGYVTLNYQKYEKIVASDDRRETSRRHLVPADPMIAGASGFGGPVTSPYWVRLHYRPAYEFAASPSWSAMYQCVPSIPPTSEGLVKFPSPSWSPTAMNHVFNALVLSYAVKLVVDDAVAEARILPWLAAAAARACTTQIQDFNIAFPNIFVEAVVRGADPSTSLTAPLFCIVVEKVISAFSAAVGWNPALNAALKGMSPPLLAPPMRIAAISAESCLAVSIQTTTAVAFVFAGASPDMMAV